MQQFSSQAVELPGFRAVLHGEAVCLVPSGAVSGTALAQAGGALFFFTLPTTSEAYTSNEAGEAARAGLASRVARCLCQHS